MATNQIPSEAGERQEKTSDTSATVITTRIMGLAVMMMGIAMIIVPLIRGADNTLTLFAYLFSGMGLIVMGYGLLQLYLWGMYFLIVADVVAIVSLIFTYNTLPFFKSFLIVLCFIIAGYLIVNRDIFKQSKFI